MRIAFVSDAIYPYNKGGKERRLYEISTRLSKMGHDVHIYTMHWWETPERVVVENGVTLHAISKLHSMYKGDRRSIKQGVIFGLNCFKLMRAQFDVIDVDHIPFFPLFSTWMVCRLRRRKMYGTWHEALRRSDWVSYMGFVGNAAALLERVSIHLPHTITVSSGHTLELIKSELKRSKRLNLITPGIDTKIVKNVRPLDVSCDVLFVGRLVKDKNVSLLIKAMAILAEHNPDIQCMIVGSGIEKGRIDRLITKLNLEQNIHLLGNLPRSRDIYGYMKASKVFVLPSSREGFGMVVLEALACGVPVVTVDHPANAAKSLVKNGVDGSVAHANPASLAEAIDQWIMEGPHHKTIAKFVAEYDWQILVNRQAEVYSR
jgi:glycosyltransferase involved in cell wall biosynthesis